MSRLGRVLVVALLCGSGACDRAPGAPDPTRPTPATPDDLTDGEPDDLPGLSAIVDPAERSQVLTVVAHIRAGGPFAYPDKDGTVFGNFERLLPERPRGAYHEYTVPTPGLSNRGARRIIAAHDECTRASPRPCDTLFYTRDHYATFLRLTTPLSHAKTSP